MGTVKEAGTGVGLGNRDRIYGRSLNSSILLFFEYYLVYINAIWEVYTFRNRPIFYVRC